MTPLSLVLRLFPAMLLGTTGLMFCYGLLSGRGGLSLLAIVAVYAVPPLAFRVHNWFQPLKEGPSHLVGDTYSSWWGGHQIQLVFIAVPLFEEVLRLVPGAFSMWLRLWGSRIGRGVYWTPHFRIADRSMIEMGNGVTLGYDTGLSAHLIKRTRKNVLLYLKRIVIEDDVFIGAGSRIGPGVTIESHCQLEGGAILYPRTRVKSGTLVRTSAPPNPFAKSES